MSEERIVTAAKVFVESLLAVRLDLEGHEGHVPDVSRELTYSRDALEELVRAVEEGR